MMLLPVLLSLLIAGPRPSAAARVSETPVVVNASPRATIHSGTTIPKVGSLLLSVPILFSSPLNGQRVQSAPVPVSPVARDARELLLPQSAVSVGPPGPPTGPAGELEAPNLDLAVPGLSGTNSLLRRSASDPASAGRMSEGIGGVIGNPGARFDRSDWFDQRRAPAAAARVPPAPVEQAARVPAETVLAPNFRNELKAIEALLPAELLERGEFAKLRAEISQASQERGLARSRAAAAAPGQKGTPAQVARMNEALAADPLNKAAENRVAAAGGELLARYNAALAPAEKLDLSSPAALHASVAWSRRLRQIGASRAFPFKSGVRARRAAEAVRAALLQELPELGSAEMDAVAKTIGVLVMKNGLVYVAFSGRPERVAALVGREAVVQARLNAGNSRLRFRVLPADTPVPEGMEAKGPDNTHCAEKKLLSVVRDGIAREQDVMEWAILWRGDPAANNHGTPENPSFMQPCEHCIHNADKILGQLALAH